MRSLADMLPEARGRSIVEGAQQNQGLKRLVLCDNCLDDAAVVLLADGLRQSMSLQALSLARNSIRDRGISCLADALKEQRTLLSQSDGVGVLELDISSNPVGNIGLEALAEVATSEWGSIEVQFVQAARGPWGLTQLRIKDHCATACGRAAIQQAVKARVDLVQMLLRVLSGHDPPKDGGSHPPKLLRVDEVDEPVYNDVMAEASLARHWEEHFGCKQDVAIASDSQHWRLEDELRALQDEREDRDQSKTVYMTHLPSSEDPQMIEEVPEDRARRDSWLPDIGNITSWFVDEHAPDALDKFWADEETATPQEHSDPCYNMTLDG